MGHAAPYHAVITLCVMAAHHWRPLRTKMLLAGIGDPMLLPSMHVLLDLTESALCESLSASERDPRDAKQKVDDFMDRLYEPEIDPVLKAKGYKATPSGFTDEEMDAVFERAVGLGLK